MSSRAAVMTAGSHHLHLNPTHQAVLAKGSCGVSDVITNAQYVSSTCIVYTFYHDVNAVIEEHFNKALRPSYKNKDLTTPMAQRNLPPSFWKADTHQSHSLTGHPDLASASHPQATHSQATSTGAPGASGNGSNPSPHESSASSSSSSNFFVPAIGATASTSTSVITSPSPSGHDLYGTDAATAAAYHHHHSPRYPAIHHHQLNSHQGHASDPWSPYSAALHSASASSHPYSPHHRSGHQTSVHDISSAYSSATNRFNAAASTYSSLLLQPSSSLRSARLNPVSPSCAAFAEKAASAQEMSSAVGSWFGVGARYHEAAMAANFGAHHHHHHSIDPTGAYSASAAYGAAMTAAAAMSGLDNQVQENTGKDLYWF